MVTPIAILGLVISFISMIGIVNIVIKRQFDKADKRKDDDVKLQVLTIKAVDATITVNSCMVEEMKSNDGKTNGKTDAAIQYAKKVQHEIRDYCLEHSIS